MGKKALTKSGTATNPLCCALSSLCALGFIVNLFGIAPLSTLLSFSQGSRRTTASTSAALSTTSVVESAAPVLLAHKESFGFFDDISDEEWRQRQRRARSHRHQVDPADKEVVAGTNPNLWYLANYYPLFSCPNQQRVGLGGDGPKWVCDPLRLGARSNDPTNKKCIVYSVGCNGNYAFEDGLVDLLGAGACEIHVFDVKPIFSRPNDIVTKGIHFHGWGLTSSYEEDAQANPRWEFLTLQETMKKLGHVGRTIDIFKIDCEGCEWRTYKDWISDDVDIRQLMIETHALASRENVRPSEFFDDIEHAGFAMFSKEPNIHPSVKGRCVEWSFVKLDKAFFAASQKKVTDQ